MGYFSRQNPYQKDILTKLPIKFPTPCWMNFSAMTRNQK